MPTYTWPGVYVEEVPSAVKPIAGVGTSTAAFIGVSANITRPWDSAKKTGMPANATGGAYPQAAVGTPKPVNSWTEFTQNFGDIQDANRYLAHAVFGFFNNGGTRCWVTRIGAPGDELDQALQDLESIDEVAIVAAPLPPDVAAEALNAAQAALIAHCEKMEDRVAILDSGRDITNDNLVITTDATGIWRPAANPKGYGAFYFPWILVADPLGQPGDRTAVPPSGHLAGIYARSDSERGVHKAPANEVILGALDVRYPVSKILQGTLNPLGVNCIRSFTGTIKVYGARTLASDPAGDPEWTYVSVRRLVNFLRESIEAGTQWVVFEPNAADLWSKIRRNVSAFLNSEWAAGALVGATPEQAFYVVCDETTNPADVRALGQVVTEIGVALVRPAEFVVFRLSQWAGPAQ
jgi:phage tail sheath protein FI